MPRPVATLLSLALLIGGVDVAGAAEVHVVMQVDLTYQPEVVMAAPGDTIRWVWTDGFHTITSGVDCMPDGVHFNTGLFSAMPVFEYPIPDDFVGEIPYYCAPHCSLGMTGNIIVAACPEDVDGSGDVGFSDVLRVLGAWGPCPAEGPCPEDLDHSGTVTFADLLMILGAWGPC